MRTRKPKKSNRQSLRTPLATLCAAVFLCACSKPPPNVYLITMDTTRADHLSPYGHDIETPNIAFLAEQGVVYDRCYTPVPITLPSHLSILTGTYPWFHGVHENAGFYVSEEMTTLAEVLSGAGYRTGAFVGSYPLDSQTGLDQGFEVYDDHYPSSLEEGKHPMLRGFFDERPAAGVVRPALQWLDDLGDDPFFLWTHFFDPHQPHRPPSPYAERYMDRPYDGEIALVDEAIGRVLEKLRSLDLLDDTVIVLTADHGEGLGDHGELTHALLLYSATVRVPLILVDPEGVPGRVTGPVVTVDIFPTLLQRLGFALPEAVQGKPLPLNDSQQLPDRMIPTETLYGALLHGWSPLERLTSDRWVYIHGPEPRLFDLSVDPGETQNRKGDHPEVVANLAQKLQDLRRSLTGSMAARASSISPEKIQRLQALGYLASSTTADPTGLRVDASLPDPHQAISVFREMNEGRQLVNDGRAALGAALLERARQSDPSNPFLLSDLARGYLGTGDLEAMAGVLEDLLSRAPENLSGWLLRAEWARRSGDQPEALAAMERAMELDPRNKASRLVLAYWLEDAARLEEALDMYRQLLKNAPDHELAVNGQGVLLYRMGRVEQAVEVFEDLLRAQPFFAPGHLNLGVIRFDQGRSPESLARVERALTLRPSYGLAYELKALLLEKAGDFDPALRAWQAALRFAATREAYDRAQASVERIEGGGDGSEPAS